MTRDEFYNALLNLGVSVNYGYSKDRKPEPPYLRYMFTDYQTMYGDNTHLADFPEGWIELYTDAMDKEFFRLEKGLEGILNGMRLPWSKDNETYIDAERLAMARYTICLT